MNRSLPPRVGVASTGLLVLWAALAVVAGCSGNRVDGVADIAVAAPDTAAQRVEDSRRTVDSSASGDVASLDGRATDASAPVTPPTAAGLARDGAIQAAIDARDLCALYAALADLQIPASTQERDRLFADIGNAMTEAQSFVPGDLRADWDTLLEVISAVATGGPVDDSGREELVALLDSTAFAAAQDHVETWTDDHCA